MRIAVLSAKRFSEGLDEYARIANEIYLENGLDSILVDLSVDFTSYKHFVSTMHLRPEKITHLLAASNFNTIHMVINTLCSDVFLSKLTRCFDQSRIVYTMHDPIPHTDKGLVKKLAKMSVIKMNKRIFKMSRYNDNLFVHLHSERVMPAWGAIGKLIFAQHPLPVINPSLLSDSQRSKKSDEPVTVAFIGNNRYNKGLDIFVDAIRNINRRTNDRENIRFVIRGKNTIVDTKGIWDLNIFADSKYLERDEFIKSIAESDIVVFPYRDATQSGVLAHARALGKFCIVTNCGALPEFITTPEAGVVIPPNDSCALANAILECANSIDRFTSPSLDSARSANALFAMKITGMKEGNKEN